MKKTIFILIGLLLYGLPAGAETKSVTLSSYYPPPVGNFDRLRLIPKDDAVSLGADSCAAIGRITFNNQDANEPHRLIFCQPDFSGGTNTLLQRLPGVWTQEGDNVFLTDNNASATEITVDKILIGKSSSVPAPVFRLTLVDDGSIIATGKEVSVDGTAPPAGDSLTTAGAGSRFIWYAKKAALRAGRVTGTQWDETKIGVGSIAFGYNTCATSYGSMVKGGAANTTSTNASGLCDAADAAFYSVIGGGYNNIVAKEYSVIMGGGYNRAFAPNSFIGGGGGGSASLGNIIYEFADNSAIGGGEANKINLAKSLIIGGQQNEILDSAAASAAAAANVFSVIGGGYQNKIDNASAKYSIIFGGKTNTLQQPHSVIGGGESNTIHYTGYAYPAVIAGGQLNEITGGSYASIIGGSANKITCSNPNSPDNLSTIGGGQNNTIQNSSCQYHSIGGGDSNSIPSSDDYAFIGGGLNNSINLSSSSGGLYNAIGGGTENTISGSGTTAAFIGGGQDNTVSNSYSAILGGAHNTVSGQYSLAAGRNMNVTSSNTFAWGQSDTTVTINSADSFIIGHTAGSIKVGIGTTAPAKTLDVAGTMYLEEVNLILTNISTTTSYDHPLIYDHYYFNHKDLAEIFPTSEAVTPGDVLVIDSVKSATLKKSDKAYDRKIAGIVSAAPAVVLEGSQTVISPKPFEFTKGINPPVALKGRVLVKVSTENGEIKTGDILTTAATPGHAMKATDEEKAVGAVIGKALGEFKGGKNGETTGMIPVLIAIH